MRRTEQKILELLQSASEELHTEKIAEALGVTRHTAAKYLEILRAKGIVQYRKLGNAKLWRVSDAAPSPVAAPAEATRLPEPSLRRPPRAFAEIHPPFNDREAVLEASRCLECGGPLEPAPCIEACPARIDIPRFIQEVFQGRPLDAARTIFAANVLGGTCARVCPVEELCEGACVLSREGRRAVEIGRLQRYATDQAIKSGEHRRILARTHGPRLPQTEKRKVAVIGAGPAGLSCAAELVKWGYSVTVFEQRERPGGLVTYAIAPYKQQYEPLPKEVEALERLGVELRFHTAVGRDVPFEEIECEYDAIFLGVGLGEDTRAGLPGEDLLGVWESLVFIEKLKEGRFEELGVEGKRVAVIGGGNTAIDVAREALRLGAQEVLVVYRRTREQMPAYAHEVEAAEREGVRFRFLTMPLRFLGERGRVAGIECLKMKLGAPDASGRPRPVPQPGTEFVLDVDLVVQAIGQRPRTDFFERLGMETEGGRVKVDERFRTSRPKYFAGGDCVNGGGTVVEAVQHGKLAAWGIHRTLSEPQGGHLRPEEEEEALPARGLSRSSGSPDVSIRTKRTKQSANGVLKHFQGDFYVAIQRAYCKGCELCVQSCPTGVLALDEKGKIVVKAVEKCVFCGICEVRCPDFAIWIVKEPALDPDLDRDCDREAPAIAMRSGGGSAGTSGRTSGRG